MMELETSDLTLVTVGVVRSEWKSPEEAPRQGVRSNAVSVLEIREAYRPALEGLAGKRTLIVLTWFHKSDRNRLRTHPKGDASRPLRGVFATRAPHRPNPIGHHVVRVMRVSNNSIEVLGMDAVNGTPIVDIKPFTKELDAPDW